MNTTHRWPLVVNSVSCNNKTPHMRIWHALKACGPAPCTTGYREPFASQGIAAPEPTGAVPRNA